MNRDQLMEKLTKLAYERSTPFCYTDYIKCPTGVCPICGSDDLMRITENDGPEYGAQWIIENILKEKLTPVDLEKTFEEVHADVYGEEVEVAWCKFSPLEIIKQLDPISWKMAIDEWANQMEEDEVFFTLDEGMTYFNIKEIEELVQLESI